METLREQEGRTHHRLALCGIEEGERELGLACHNPAAHHRGRAVMCGC